MDRDRKAFFKPWRANGYELSRREPERAEARGRLEWVCEVDAGACSAGRTLRSGLATAATKTRGIGKLYSASDAVLRSDGLRGITAANWRLRRLGASGGCFVCLQ